MARAQRAGDMICAACGLVLAVHGLAQAFAPGASFMRVFVCGELRLCAAYR